MNTYVYCFTRASHPLALEGIHGVGGHAPSLRVVQEGALAAVVSDAPLDLRPKRRDLTTHDAVIGGLCTAGTVLPMRFGMVASDDAAVRAVLRTEARNYAELLSRLDGRVEVNVKGAHDEDVVLRDLLVSDQELGAHNAALRSQGGGSHQDKLAFGARVAAALEDRRARDAERTLARLRTYAVDVRRGPPVADCFVNLSFLVPLDARQALETAVTELEDELGLAAQLRSRGPLPPYSFVGAGPGA